STSIVIKMVKKNTTNNSEAKNKSPQKSAVDLDDICDQLARQTLTPTKNGKQKSDSPPITPVTNGKRSAIGPSTPHRIQALNEDKLQLGEDSPPRCESPYRKRGSSKTTSKRQVKGNKFAAKIAISTTGSTKIKSSSLKSKSVISSTDSQITDFFPIRRSDRKSKSSLLQEKQNDLEQCIRSKKAEGLKIEDFGAKGRGVVATRPIQKGDFVIEYIGDLMDQAQAKAKEDSYSHDPSKGCYSYYFVYGGLRWCIDATDESPYMGRLVNHSRRIPNMVTKTVEVDGLPHLILLAKRDIKEGEELLYDYGDRSKESLEHHPWLAL
ncbi:unnamed protein product, partial [Meganyctiphanes norvegica]